ncbi:MAG: extracellular solute-binding protein [Chloroflexi bacterium]|nr:extracellular solute-binding protein [Chloroflexota bacterium]
MESDLRPRRFSRRVLLAGMTGASAALLVVACGAPPAPTPTAAPKPTEKPAAAPVAKAPATAQAAAAPSANIRGKQGTLWGLKYDPHVETYNQLVAAFEKKTGAKLTVEPQAGDVVGAVVAAIAAGAPPDVHCLMGKALLPLLMRKVLVDVTPLYREMQVNPKEDFVGDAIGAYSYDGKIWGVPVEINNVGHLLNVPFEDVEKAGIKDKTPPWNGKDFFDSYEHLWETAKPLMVKGSDGTVSRWGLSSKGWVSASLLGMIRSQGVKWWDKDTKKFNINSEAGITAFKLLIETPVKLGIESELNTAGTNAALAGKVAIARAAISPSLRGRPLGYHFEIAMAPPVKGPVSPTDPLYIGEGGWGFIGYTAARNKDIAAEFLRFMTTKDAQWIWGSYAFSGTALASSFRAVNEDPARWPEKDKWETTSAQRLMRHANRVEYYGEEFGYAGEIDKHANAVGDEVRQGKLTAEQGAKQLQDLFEQQYKQYLEDLKKYGS